MLLKSSFSGAAAWRSALARKLPDFFIVGAPKCGTTAMAEYLAGHPDIYMARKELHFFGTDLEFAPSFYRRDRQAYLAEFAGWNGQRRLGEASVSVSLLETGGRRDQGFQSGREHHCAAARAG